MADATIRAALNIDKDALSYHSRPTVFTTGLDTGKGPTPGAIDVTEAGVSVDLSELTIPGFCWICNLDATNYVILGVYSPDLDLFYPLQEIGPEEHYILKIYREFGAVFGSEGTGTGTAGSSNNRIHLRSAEGTCKVRIDAFER